MAIIEEVRYILTDIIANNNKWWNAQLHDDGTVTAQWGRVGNSGQTGTWGGGRGYLDAKCREKEKKGYERSQVIEASAHAAPHVVKGAHLADVATKQIKTTNPIVTALVQRLAEWNVHNILNSTTMKYDTSAGTFRTPLGIVTQSAINEARTLLSNIGDFVFAQDYENPEFARTVNKFLMLVPQDIGMGRLDLRTFYPNVQQVQSQGQILDALEGSLAAVLTAPVDKDKPQVAQEQIFNVQMETVEDGKVIDRIRKFYKATWQAIHDSSRLDVHRVYEIQIGHMNEAFEEKGCKIGNIRELWHGTRVGNLLSMLKSGFVIPAASSSHCTGRMFGNGAYFSDQSTKSLNYATGSAPGQRGGYESVTYMFLVDVAMGREYTPRSWQECQGWNAPKDGFDSTFAKGGYSGVSNNEMIVYRTSQINPKFLIEFK